MRLHQLKIDFATEQDRLLQAAVKKSDWDMDLKLPGVEPQESTERARRTIN